VQKETVSGSASFVSSDPSHLQITASDKAIINYHTFNISESEHVEFVQPSNKSCLLNRVVGKDPSKILGKLDGNGRIFLVNPQGIYFGKDATVNTGALLPRHSIFAMKISSMRTTAFSWRKEQKAPPLLMMARFLVLMRGVLLFFLPISRTTVPY